MYVPDAKYEQCKQPPAAVRSSMLSVHRVPCTSSPRKYDTPHNYSLSVRVPN